VRVLGFGTYDLRRHPRTGIIMAGLRAHGAEVAELNVPLGFSTAERVAMLQKPWLAYRLALRLTRCWWTLARRARRIGRADAILVGYLGHFDVLLARVCFPRTHLVLDQMIFAADTAEDRGVSSRLKHRLLRSLDNLATRTADTVLLDSTEHLSQLAPRDHAKAVVVPIGASAEWFAVGARAVRRDPAGPLRAVFFGTFTPLQGAPVIGRALALLADRPDIVVTMIGTGQDYDLTRAAAGPNAAVRWIDWVEPDRIAAIIADHDACLGIFSCRPKALRVTPNKVCEGAAAGCAIVTSDTPVQRRALADAAVFVPPEDARALAEALRGLADDPARLDRLRTAARARAEQMFTGPASAAALHERLVRTLG
jgi:glycosyltransferase involved in cell wall biosynthesis